MCGHEPEGMVDDDPLDDEPLEDDPLDGVVLDELPLEDEGVEVDVVAAPDVAAPIPNPMPNAPPPTAVASMSFFTVDMVCSLDIAEPPWGPTTGPGDPLDHAKVRAPCAPAQDRLRIRVRAAARAPTSAQGARPLGAPPPAPPA
jgi:hypothetical protein